MLHRNGSGTAEPLTAVELQYFRELLIERRARLLDEAGRTAQDMGRSEPEGFPDPTDRGVLESERNLELRIRDRERKLIGKIDEALERIERGTFGRCEECRQEIPADRLQAVPFTRYCIECARRLEREGLAWRTRLPSGSATSGRPSR